MAADGGGWSGGEAEADGRRRADKMKTLIEVVYHRLRKDIISGHLAPGSKLRVEHLRSDYNIGSSTLREALTRLVSDSLVIAEGQRGFKVAPISIDDLKDITRTRKMLESWALAESIRLGDDRWEAGIVAAFHRLSRAEERLPGAAGSSGGDAWAEEWEERNREFHLALVAACPSPWTLRFCEILYYQSERYRRFSLSSRDGMRNVHDEHKAQMEAALAHDAPLACRLIGEHIDNTLATIVRIIAKPASPPARPRP